MAAPLAHLQCKFLFRGALAEPLAEELGKPLDPQDGDLRITLNYIHPGSAPESDFLFGRPFKGRSQKKRRKRQVIDVGGFPHPVSTSNVPHYLHAIVC